MVNGTVLLIAFVVMMAALSMGNRRPEAELYSFSGTVVDQDGSPIDDVHIYLRNESGDGIEARTDIFGKYNMTVDVDVFIMLVSIVAYKDGYWANLTGIIHDYEVRSQIVDFALTDMPDTAAPFGPMVIASTVPDSTMVKTHVRFVDAVFGMQYVMPDGSTSLRSSPVWLEYEGWENRSDGVPSYPFTNGILVGMTTDLTGYEDGFGLFFMTMSNSGPEGGNYYNISSNHDPDYLSRRDVIADSSFISLAYGENYSVSIAPQGVRYFDARLCPDETIRVEGREVVLAPVYGMDAGNGANAMASVTIEPLTPGHHTYQVYVENGLVIHVWELA